MKQIFCNVKKTAALALSFREDTALEPDTYVEFDLAAHFSDWKSTSGMAVMMAGATVS